MPASKLAKSRHRRAISTSIVAGLAAVAVGLTGFSGTASAQTVQNGSFSTNNGSLTSTYIPTTSNLTNWTVTTTNTNPDPCVVYNNAFGACGYTPVTTAGLGVDPANSPYFGAGAWGGSSAIISQTISGLTNGKQYVISFYQAALEDQSVVDNGVTWTVNFGGTTLNSTPMNIPAGGLVAWSSQPVSMIFTANATSDTLSFLASGGSGSAPPLALLDGITISQVPEPASLALLGLGAVGLAALRRRRSYTTA